MDTDTGTDAGTGTHAEALARLARTYPLGKAGVMPVDSYTGHAVTVSVLPIGAREGIQPHALTRSTIRGVKFYVAQWENGAPARFIGKRDANRFLDLHYYAVGYRRITGSLPDWASERTPR